MTGHSTARIGLVAIGRNEGERLRQCLESLLAAGAIVVYVDSASTDASCKVARALGIEVLELSPESPLNAARAREAGWRRLSGLAPHLDYVQFIDGDCILDHQWLDHASEYLDRHDDVAVVCGRRRETCPAESLFHRLIDLEWNTAVGEAEACGGDAMIRTGALEEVGGFDSSLLAGEEHELCFRLRGNGWRIRRLDAEMTQHDAATHSIAQWWRRETRTGFGALEVWHKCGANKTAPFHGLLRSSWMWGPAWFVAAMLAAGAGWLFAGVVGVAIGLGAGVAVWGCQALRIAENYSRRGLMTYDALVCGFLTLLGKWPQLLGQWRSFSHRRTSRTKSLVGAEASGRV